MNILFEDESIIVCIKPPSLVSEQTTGGDSLADLLAARNSGYIGVVHRLDRGVGGVMVYAKTAEAAGALSRQVQERVFQKEYLAIIHGAPAEASGTWTDLLFHDRRINKSYVVSRKRAGVKEAILDYVVQKSGTDERHGTLSLVRVKLHTGRTHQIRVQFSSRRHPLLGDGKYGASDGCSIALFSTRIAFTHPKSGKALCFEALPTDDVWQDFLA